MRNILLIALIFSASTLLGQENLQGDLLPGCMDTMACNYDPLAEFDDGTCEFVSCEGCTNSEATNFDSTATIDDGLCLFEDLCGQVYGDDMIVNDFTAHYAPGLWNIYLGGNGTVDITSSQMYIVGINEDDDAIDAITQATINAVSSGTVTFSWSFTTEDEDGAGFDLGYYINGIRYDLDDSSGEITQVGVVSIEVTQGDLFGFGVDATDGCCGGGFLTITDFTSEVADCIGGCLDSGACNYDSSSGYDDDSCEYESCAGCTDSEAMNYDSTSTIDDASCLYIDPCGTISDIDGNGFGFIGHYQSNQWSFYADTDGTVSIEETYIHIIGGNAQDFEDFSGQEGEGVQGGGGDYETLTQVSRTAAATGTYTFNWSYSTEDGPEYDIAYYINGVRYDLTQSDGDVVQVGSVSFDAIAGDVIGFGIDSTDDCCGTGELTITDFTYPAGDCLMGCTDSEACNYDSSANFEDDSCDFESCLGCMDSGSCNFDSTATIDDDSCDFESCYGCMDSGACNYDSSATMDDESCDYEFCMGCTDSTACNYDSTATMDDGSCAVGLCIGCMDSEACNFNANASEDDGSCLYGPDPGFFENLWAPFFANCEDYSDIDDSEFIGVFEFDEDGIVYSFGEPVISWAGCGTSFVISNESEIIGYGDLVDGTLEYSEFGTCLLFVPAIDGCMDEDACDYNELANFQMEDCDYSCIGCSDPMAENYDSEVTIDDGSCVFIDDCGSSYNDQGNAINFTGEFAPENWSFSSNDNGDYDITETTIVLEGGDFAPPTAGDSEGLAGDGGGSVTQVYITSPVNGAITFDWDYSTDDFSPSSDYAYYINGAEYDLSDDGGANSQSGSITLETTIGMTIGFAINSTSSCCGAATLEIQNFTYPLGDCIGGCLDMMACNYDSTADYDNETCDYESCAGCTDMEACNYNGSATIDDDSCEYDSCAGCMDLEACNYDSFATIEDDSCEYESCAGCMDMEACNYDATATIGDGSCEYDTCAGCTDMESCNYDSSATIDDDSCEYDSCAGCTDMLACNYDSTATIDDDSCEYESCAGCTDMEACNYDSAATLLDDSCEYDSCAGCTDMEACNYDSSATIVDDSCEYDSCAGCTDMEACNYDSTATIDDDSCEYESCAGCTDMEACNYDSTATIDDDSCEFESCAGCTDSSALNYDSTATIDDGSCFDECEFPTLEFVVYCEDGDLDNFYVELTVSGSSNAFPFTIDNDANASTENVMMAGVHNLGAFANNSFVEFTITSDDYGCSMTSDMLSSNCMIDAVVEIETQPLSIYPNPTKGDFTVINAMADHTMTIEIMNNLGQLVFAQQASSNEQGNFTINTFDQLANGNYMVRVTQGNEIQVVRIIVQK